jgi:glycosyltransferase involved in cell wall biosynthesis
MTSRGTLLIIPTHHHPTCLPLAIASAQRQSIEDIDIVVIGDGVTDDTRDVIMPIQAGDKRVRFLDLPKAIRHGEEYRDTVIRQSTASVISYLGDDDLLFPHHLETMQQCIADVDFANPLPIFIEGDATLTYTATDLANPASLAWHLDPRMRRNSVSLTGATHTRESYLRLPHGWRPAPPGRWTDHYMWEQYFRLPGFTARTSHLSTTAKFRQWDGSNIDTYIDRVSEIREFANRMSEPDFVAQWNADVAEHIRRESVKSLLLLTDFEKSVGLRLRSLLTGKLVVGRGARPKLN